MPSELIAAVLFEKVTGPYWGPSIELPTSLGTLDLHNFASFTRLTYDSAGLLELEWQADNPEGMLFGARIAGVRLVFSGMSALTVMPRDPEMPAREDRTLDHFLVNEARTGRYRVHLSFLGGMEIDVTASELQVIVVE
jgi:hypothetical protein